MSEEKNFWIINQYSSTPNTGIGGRHFYLAQELAKLGHKVFVIAGSYSHLLDKPHQFDDEYLIERVQENFDFVWVKLPWYDNAHSKFRIINEFNFASKLLKLRKLKLASPNVIIYSSPALIGYLSIKYLSNYYKVPSVFEIRDPWPLTLIEIGGYSKNHPFIRFLQWIEDKAYKESDFVFSNFFNAIEHMQSRGLDKRKFSWIPNGVSLDELNNPDPLEEKILNQIPSSKFIIGYTGTIGEANALKYLISAAKLVSDFDEIHFVIVGKGKDKEILKREADKIGNFTFIDSIPKKQVQSMLQRFDVCYIGWHKNPMYRLGISANKLPEYMFSGKPVLHSYSGKGDFIQQANAGITVEAENPQKIADGILRLYRLSKEERNRLGNNGKNFVLKNLTYDEIAKKLISIIFQ